MTLTLPQRIRHRIAEFGSDTRGAIDLASIMVGVLVIGIVGGVIAATVFAVIPWSQNEAAKQNLAAVGTAEDVSLVLDNKFHDNAGLYLNKRIPMTPSIAVGTNSDGTCYVAVSKSDTGDLFYKTNKGPDVMALIGATVTGCDVDVAALIGAVNADETSAAPALQFQLRPLPRGGDALGYKTGDHQYVPGANDAALLSYIQTAGVEVDFGSGFMVHQIPVDRIEFLSSNGTGEVVGTAYGSTDDARVWASSVDGQPVLDWFATGVKADFEHPAAWAGMRIVLANGYTFNPVLD